MLVVALSIITGQFPPDLERLQRSYSSLQEMTTLSRKIFEQRKSMDKEQAKIGSVEDEDLHKLEELYLRRAELGANLLPSDKDLSPLASPSTAAVSEGKTQAQLEGKIRELQQDLFRLQERVHRLESRFERSEQ